ncbi:ATP-binding cassette domain-containing protein [Acinetobacter genomosp. 15BJ]|uniref:ATP-binding cassette domain-containing protein n=1 Tax=Acinetobacter genomosp. 15BJ TaxID=106651 RepID=A0ABT8UUV1_9GAMM|nr:hypothetical protein [Acinetobacter genomosp. 15BJ]MDO3656812.1 hypothetical protein [Acinetobacter genomosp. 15BJ]
MKKNYFLKRMFFQKEATVTLSLIGIHQFFIALSVYYLTLLIQNYQSKVDFKYNLMMYFFCMLFPYIPAFLSFISMQKWINKAHFDFVKILIKGPFFFPAQFTNIKLKDKFDSIISRNSFGTISSYFVFIHDALSLLLNSIFSMFVIGLLLPSELVGGYLISVLLSFIIIFLSHKKLDHAAVDSELKFINYSSLLAKGWSNLSLKNKINTNIWRSNLDKESENYYKSTIYLQILKQSINGLLAAVALIPTAYLIYHIIFNGYEDAAVIAAIIVNLTRIFNILSSLNSLLHLLIELPVMNAHFKVLFSFEDFLDKKINTATSGNITINGEKIYDYKDAFNMIEAASNGRFTLRGSNGSGKTTLLYYLKNLFGEKAILMPASHNFLMWGVDGKALSTGQLAIQTIKELYSQPENILFLDEWDANLDSQNKSEINQLLDNLSTQKIIVEVRH